MSDKNKPEILDEKWVANSRLFHVQQQDLRFSNGVERSYERLNPFRHKAVMVIAAKDAHAVLVREYGAGIGDYYLSFPKGAVDKGEEVLQAADRELMEEAGFTAKHYQFWRTLRLSPSYMGNSMDLVFASGLSEKSIPGDEPEPLELVLWPLEKLPELLDREEFCEAYGQVAAMKLYQMYLAGELNDS